LSTTDDQAQKPSAKPLTVFQKDAMVLGIKESLTGNTIYHEEFRPSVVVVVEIGPPVPGGAIWRTHSAGTFYYYGCSCNTWSQRMM
jgi:hypothetical protein